MRHGIALTAGLLLAACGDGGESGGNKQAAAGGGGSGVTMQPGEWEMTTEIVSMNIPNMPQGMTPPRQPPQTHRSCITEEESRNPTADFFQNDNDDCTAEGLSFANGRIGGTLQCRNEGGTMRMTLDGRYTATTVELNQQMQTSAQGTTMTMEARTTGRRVGECPEGQEEGGQGNNAAR